MAHHKSAIKRIALSKKQNQRNRSYKSSYRTSVKRVLKSTSKDSAVEELKIAESFLDKLTAKKILHRNHAARKKSQLAQYVNKLA